MPITFTARHFKATPRLKEYATRKVSRLNRYFSGIIDSEVILSYEKQTQIAEVVINVYGQKLVAIEKSEDMFKSIDQAADKVERQIKKYKGKLRSYNTLSKEIPVEEPEA